MAYDPMEGFQVGQAIGKSKRSSLSRTSDYMSDLFKERDKKESSGDNLLKLAILKSSIQSPLQQAQTQLANAKTNWIGGAQGTDPNAEGMVLDRVGPNGPTFVNQKERTNTKMLASQAEQLPKLDRAFDAVQSLKDQYNRSIQPVSIERGGNPIAGFARKQMQGLGANVSAMSGTNPEMNRYKANRAGFASLLSKGGFMEAGVLTNQDIDRMLNILPNEFSTKEEADIAWNEVENVLHSARARFESGGGIQRPAEEQANPQEDAKERLRKKLLTKGLL